MYDLLLKGGTVVDPSVGLHGVHDIAVQDGKIAQIRTKELREAMETALLERRPLAIIVDEAHHLAEAARGSRLQSQLNHLKHFENATGVSHIMYNLARLLWKRTLETSSEYT